MLPPPPAPVPFGGSWRRERQQLPKRFDESSLQTGSAPGGVSAARSGPAATAVGKAIEKRQCPFSFYGRLIVTVTDFSKSPPHLLEWPENAWQHPFGNAPTNGKDPRCDHR
ncbi:hypothetical protein GCM10022629_42590 [Amorphoplanes auranticolor]